MSTSRSSLLNEGCGELRRTKEGTDVGVVVHEVDHERNHAREYPYRAEGEGNDLETQSFVGPFSREREEGDVEEEGAEAADEDVADRCNDANVSDF